MKNIIKKIGGLCLGLAMLSGVAVGVNSTKPNEVKATDANFTLSSNTDITVSGVTAHFEQDDGTTAPTWYAAGLRLYAKNTITISCDNDITSISFNWEKQGSKAFASVTANTGSYSHPSAAGTGSWTGTGKSIVFTLGDAGQLQLNTFTVTYSGSAPTSFKVTYNGNNNDGGSVPIDDTSYSSGANVTVLGNTGNLSKTGYSFSGWNSKTDGSGTDYSVGSTFNITDATTLYAKWIPNEYTLSFNLNNGTGITPSPITAEYDSQITLPDETGISREGYQLSGWNTSADGTGDNYQLGGSYKMGLSTTLYAKWAEKGAAYKLVTDASDLHAGDIIAIVNSDGYALSTTQATNNRTATSITIDSNYFLATSEVQEIVLGGDSAGWTFDVGTGYLYAAGGTKSNYLKTKSDLSASAYWSISITDNVSTIKTTDTATTKNWLRFNLNTPNTPMFSCYSSGQKDVQIYKKYTSASFAKELLDKTDTICSTSGEHIASDFSTIWGELAGSQCWSLLTAAEKSVFASSAIDPSGSITEQAAARYDQLVHKYALENFANRSVSPVNQNLISIIGENNAATWIIVAVSLAGLTAIGGYFFYKKRKENF